MKPINRKKLIGFRVTTAEWRYLERIAAERGQRLSAFLRAMLLPYGVVIDQYGKIKD